MALNVASNESGPRALPEPDGLPPGLTAGCEPPVVGSGPPTVGADEAPLLQADTMRATVVKPANSGRRWFMGVRPPERENTADRHGRLPGSRSVPPPRRQAGRQGVGAPCHASEIERAERAPRPVTPTLQGPVAGRTFSLAMASLGPAPIVERISRGGA